MVIVGAKKYTPIMMADKGLLNLEHDGGEIVKELTDEMQDAIEEYLRNLEDDPILD